MLGADLSSCRQKIPTMQLLAQSRRTVSVLSSRVRVQEGRSLTFPALVREARIPRLPTLSETRALHDDLIYGTEAARLAGLDREILEHRATIFAPSDDALTKYAKVYPKSVTSLRGEAGRLAIITHIIPDKHIRMCDLQEGEMSFPTKEGSPIKIQKSGNDVIVSSGPVWAKVIRCDVQAGNAVVHIIDNVLSPIGG